MSLTAVFEYLRSNKQLKQMRIDSRQIQPGDIFVAIPGFTTDGRKFIPQAIANGAALIICEESTNEQNPSAQHSIPILEVKELAKNLPALAAHYYQEPSQRLKVIGVTGTNGKTSTTNYIAQLLTAQKNICGVMGTLGIGILPDIIKAELTTSDCCTIQQELKGFVDAHANFVVMEVSSIGLDQGRLLNTHFDTAVFTNLTQDHLDYHKNMENYFAAKCKFFTDFPVRNCVINLDDDYSQRLLKIIPDGCTVVTFSLHDHNADLYLDNDKLITPWGNGILNTKLIGRFNISNVLAAIACCALQGIEVSTLLEHARDLQPVCGRMELIPTPINNSPRVIVDYSHTPDALIKALTTLREYNPEVLYCVFGCGGDRDRRKRPLMTQAVLDNSDQAIITNDNPRTEDPQQIVQDMLSNAILSDNVTIELDRAKAIQQTIARATANDIVLIAGKGHEDYQIIGTTKHPFSDQLVAQEALGAKI